MHGIDLTVIGPEVPLARGLADRLRAEGRAVFGPERRGGAARGVEGVRQGGHGRGGHPTAASRTLPGAGRRPSAYVDRHPEPLVVKASGLAAGKGAVVCRHPRGGRGRGPRHAGRPGRSATAGRDRRRSRRSSRARRSRFWRSPTGATSSSCRSPRITSGCSRATPGPTPAAWAPTVPWRWPRRPCWSGCEREVLVPDPGGDAAPGHAVRRRAVRRA